MSWAVEEYAEDAVVAYLGSKLAAGLLAVYPAWTDTEIKYPCVIIHAGESGNVTGQFNGVRRLSMSLAVMSEAVAQGGMTAREANRKYRNAVIEALAYDDLHDEINALKPFGVEFSRAEVGAITRSVDEARRVFVSEIALDCIAAPKELI
jgi:hypothetical protein